MVVISKKKLVQKIYFRFGRKNSKWPPKTGFSLITRELENKMRYFQNFNFIFVLKLIVAKILRFNINK